MFKCFPRRNPWQALGSILIQHGTSEFPWRAQCCNAPHVHQLLNSRGYHRRYAKNRIKSHHKVGKHWNCRNARDKSLEIIHARYATQKVESEEPVSRGLYGDDVEVHALAEEEEYNDAVSSNKAFRRPSKYSPPEDNLLTWSAKEQLRYLHNSDPSEWTPERLAECFPISVDGVKKMLRSTFVIETAAQIRKHDLGVMKKWQAVCSGKGGPLSPVVAGSLLNRPPLLEHAAGNSNLPMPPPKSENMSNEPSVSVRPAGPGYFESLIYSEEKQHSKSETLQLTQWAEPNLASAETSALPQHRKSKIMTASQFMESLLKELETTKKTSAVSDKTTQYQQWITKQIAKLKIDDPPQPTDFVEPEKTQVKEKYAATQQPSIRWDVRRDQTLPEAYIYTSAGGYQQPFGKVDDEPDKLNIPRHRRRSGGMYRKGDAFYDESGEFLYRVPGLK